MTVALITENTTQQNGATADDQYTGVVDARLDSSVPNTASPSATRNDSDKFGVGDHKNSLVLATGLSNIPSGAVVSSALYYQYQNSTNGTHNVALHRVLQNWDTLAASWNQYDNALTSPSGDWNTAGATGSGTDVTGTAEDTISCTNNTAWYSWDVTSLVQNIVDGTISTDEGFLLTRPDAGNDSLFKGFASSNGTDGERPELLVTYTTGGAGASSGTSTPTAVGESTYEGDGSSSGTSNTSATIISIFSASGSISGSSSTSSTGESTHSTDGSSSGLATVSGVGEDASSGTTNGDGTSSGTSNVTGTSSSVAEASGSSSGISSVVSTGESTVSSNGSSSGLATVTAIGIAGTSSSGVGVSSGTSTVIGIISAETVAPAFIEGAGASILGYNGQYYSTKVG